MGGSITVYALTFMVGIVGSIGGVAIGYGMMRQQVRSSADEIVKLQERLSIINGTNPVSSGTPLFVKHSECDVRERVVTKEIEDTKHEVELLRMSLKGIQNFTRWILTTKEGLGLSEVNKILEGN